MIEPTQDTIENEMFERFLRGKDQEFFIEYTPSARMTIFENYINSLSPFELLQKISEVADDMYGGGATVSSHDGKSP